MKWPGPERIGEKPINDLCCDVKSHDEYMRERAAALRAQNTTMSLETGFQGEAMDPQANIGMKKWSGK